MNNPRDQHPEVHASTAALRLDETRFLGRNVGGEYIILNLETDEYFTLNETASRLLDLLQQEPLGDAVAHVCEEYDVAEEDARADAEALLRELAGIGVVHRSPGTAA